MNSSYFLNLHFVTQDGCQRPLSIKRTVRCITCIRRLPLKEILFEQGGEISYTNVFLATSLTRIASWPLKFLIIKPGPFDIRSARQPGTKNSRDHQRCNLIWITITALAMFPGSYEVLFATVNFCKSDNHTPEDNFAQLSLSNRSLRSNDSARLPKRGLCQLSMHMCTRKYFKACKRFVENQYRRLPS